jgi:hypothetical protein
MPIQSMMAHAVERLRVGIRQPRGNERAPIASLRTKLLKAEHIRHQAGKAVSDLLGRKTRLAGFKR